MEVFGPWFGLVRHLRMPSRRYLLRAGLRKNICVRLVLIFIQNIGGARRSDVRLQFVGLFAMEEFSRLGGLLYGLKRGRKPLGHVMYAHSYFLTHLQTGDTIAPHD